jgi:predicted DNA-binding transcriptional regulator AlpA
MKDADQRTNSDGAPKPLLLKADDVARLIAVSTRTLWRLVRAGQFPRPIYVGGSSRWRQVDVESWVQSQDFGKARKV